MHYIDRWIFSQFVATIVAITLAFWFRGWYDMIPIFFVTMAVNNLRLTLSRNRGVA